MTQCKKCKKKFNFAGNIRNYLIVCPHCGNNHTLKELQQNTKGLENEYS